MVKLSVNKKLKRKANFIGKVKELKHKDGADVKQIMRALKKLSEEEKRKIFYMIKGVELIIEKTDGMA